MPHASATHYDTIIAGAGPAGVMTAIEAARRGPVLLVDSSALPRDKSCGGMLNAHAQSFLNRFGRLPDDLILGPAHVNFRYWDWDRGVRKTTELRFLNVDRRRFDEWLVSLLPDSVEVIDSAVVRSFEQDDHGVTVMLKNGGAPEEVRCRNLVGCDGARSAVRRGLERRNAPNYVTLQDFVRLEGELEPYFDCIYMRGIGDCYAYSYIVPKGDSAIVGTVFYPKTKRPHDKHSAVLDVLRKTLPQLGESFKREAGVALCVRSPDDVVAGAGHVLLAGEAGGFMSPTSGEGISYAMNTGRLAGEAIAASGPDECCGRYEAAVSCVTRNIRRKLKWLPFMESSWGKYLAGLAPTSLVSRITNGL